VKPGLIRPDYNNKYECTDGHFKVSIATEQGTSCVGSTPVRTTNTFFPDITRPAVVIRGRDYKIVRYDGQGSPVYQKPGLVKLCRPIADPANPGKRMESCAKEPFLITEIASTIPWKASVWVNEPARCGGARGWRYAEHRMVGQVLE
jgi:hypothetical protein